MERYQNYANHRSTLLELTMEDAKSAYHPGSCEKDVEDLSKVPYVAAQLSRIDPGELRSELEECGTWDDEQLSDHGENIMRWLWISAADIVDGNPIIVEGE